MADLASSTQRNYRKNSKVASVFHQLLRYYCLIDVLNHGSLHYLSDLPGQGGSFWVRMERASIVTMILFAFGKIQRVNETTAISMLAVVVFDALSIRQPAVASDLCLL